jgi:hypothetical protein
LGSKKSAEAGVCRCRSTRLHVGLACFFFLLAIFLPNHSNLIVNQCFNTPTTVWTVDWAERA